MTYILNFHLQWISQPRAKKTGIPAVWLSSFPGAAPFHGRAAATVRGTGQTDYVRLSVRLGLKASGLSRESTATSSLW